MEFTGSYLGRVTYEFRDQNSNHVTQSAKTPAATASGCAIRFHLVGTPHSVNFSFLVSSMATLSPRYCANHRRSCASIWPRRGCELRVGVGSSLILPVWASTRPMFSLPKSIKKRLFLESAAMP